MLTDSRIDFDGVIFDFDNTLVDTASAINDAYKLVFSTIARDFNVDGQKMVEEADRFQREKIKELSFSKKSYNHADWIFEITALMSIDLGEKVEKYKDIFYSYVIKNPKFSDDTTKILKALKDKGKKLALLSEKDSVPGMKQKRIEKVPFFSYFDEIVIAGETFPFSKTNGGSKSFLATANLMGLDPKDVVVVGDRPDLDIQNAKEAGMKAILFSGYSDSNEFTKYLPDFTIKRISDLGKILL